jgi:hypothetical protein
MATFRRMGSGEWVVCGTVEEVRVGKVRVSRKDNSVRTVDVASVGRPFRAFDGKQMVYGYLKARGETEAAPPPQATAPSTSPEPVVDYSDAF